jgi:phosphatidylinositol phospholipase C, delta
MSTHKFRYCCCFTRKFHLQEVEPPDDVRALFQEYSEGGPHMSPDQLSKFLAAPQAEADNIIDRIRQQKGPLARISRPVLTLDDFHHFLFSQELNPPFKSEVSFVRILICRRFFIF